MSLDDFKRAWQTPAAQGRLTVDAERLLAEVRRNRRWLAAVVLWRDVREVGVAFLLVPLWFYLGSALALPWTWYLMVPALLWIGGFLLADRLGQRGRAPEPGEPLVQCIRESLAEVEHQIRLLRGVLWWYLFPPALAAMPLLAQLAWETRSAGIPAALILASVGAVAAAVLAGVYWANQAAVRSTLQPRQEELRALLASLTTPPAGAGGESAPAGPPS